MRVDERTAGLAAGANRAQEARRTEELEAAGPRQAAGSSARDQVQVSRLAGSVANALEASSAQRSVRVERLAALYNSGEYKVDAAQVSRAMISNALEFGAV